MRKYLNPFQFNAIVLTAVLGFFLATQADDSDKMPTAVSVLKKFTDASGGAAKFKAIKTVKMNGSVSIPAAGVEGTLEVIQMSPDKVSSQAELPQVGSQSQGTDGKVAWELSTMMGPRVLEKKERVRLMDQANFQKYYDPEGYYKEMKVVGTEEINGEKSFKLKLTNQNDVTSTEYFSAKTGLQLASEITMASQMGEIEIKSMMSDYKEIGGVQMPHKIESKFPNGMSQVITLEKIEINSDVDAKAFEVPEEIKALVEESKKEEAAGDK